MLLFALNKCRLLSSFKNTSSSPTFSISVVQVAERSFSLITLSAVTAKFRDYFGFEAANNIQPHNTLMSFVYQSVFLLPNIWNLKWANYQKQYSWFEFNNIRLLRYSEFHFCDLASGMTRKFWSAWVSFSTNVLLDCEYIRHYKFRSISTLVLQSWETLKLIHWFSRFCVSVREQVCVHGQFSFANDLRFPKMIYISEVIGSHFISAQNEDSE